MMMDGLGCSAGVGVGVRMWRSASVSGLNTASPYQGTNHNHCVPACD